MTRDIYQDSLVNKEQLEEIRRSVPPKAFEQEFECHFLDSSLTFFEGFEKSFVSPFKYDTSQKQWIGIDLSADGSDATIISKVNALGQSTTMEIGGSIESKIETIRKVLETEPFVFCYIENNRYRCSNA